MSQKRIGMRVFKKRIRNDRANLKYDTSFCHVKVQCIFHRATVKILEENFTTGAAKEGGRGKSNIISVV